jgi:hypothetical protein
MIQDDLVHDKRNPEGRSRFGSVLTGSVPRAAT